VRLLLIVGINLIFCLPSFADEGYTLEKIVVTGDSGNNRNQNYQSETISGRDIKEKQINSAADILRYVPGVDLRYRGTSGIQGDLSVRGSTYEEVAVLIDGIRINDPQTGHYNLDLPLTAMDIEKIQVIKQGSSSLYGTGALSGTINIITKRPLKKSRSLEITVGQHALYSQAFLCDMPAKDISNSFSYEHKISNGARPNTDFEYQTFSYILNKDWQDNSLNFLAGYQDKDYGADGFYSNLYNEEEEHTETLFVKAGLDSDLGPSNLKNSAFLRRHHDRFLLNRNNPLFYQNMHTTYSYGIHSGIDWPVKYGDMETGFEIARDEINSTNLGKNTRINEAWFLGFNPAPENNIETSARFRIDHFQNWSYQDSFDSGAGWRLADNKLKIKACFSHAFRGPSFTELYYSDPANKGNADLKVEKSDNYSIGLETNYRDIEIECGGFLRKVTNLIDYIRPTVNDVWQAANLGKVYFKGLELKAGPFSYTYMEANKDNTGYLSKYALDILKHQLMFNLRHSARGLKIDWRLSYNERKFGETYFIGDVCVSKAFENKNTVIEPFIKIDNFTDTNYTEVAGVLQPGRWVQSGIKIKW